MTGAQTAATCGLCAVVLVLLVPILGAMNEPGYSHAAQFISELGARGATNAAIVSFAGFAPIGALVLFFLVAARQSFPQSQGTTVAAACLALVGFAYLAAAAFPCDPGCPNEGSTSQAIHSTFGFFEYVGALIGLPLFALTFRTSPRWRSLATPSLVAALLVAGGLFAMLTPSLASVRGLSQRVAETGIFGWLAYASALLLRQR